MNRSEDPILSEEREELKRQITAGEYKSLLDVMSDKAEGVIQKLTKRTEPLPFWYAATVIALVILIAGLLTSLLLGEFSPARRRSIWGELLASAVIVVGLAALKSYLDRLYATLLDKILDRVHSAEDVADLRCWLAGTAKVRRHLIFSLAYALPVGLPLNLAGGAVAGGPISVGANIALVGVNLGGAILVWYIVRFLSFARRLSGYRFDLYVADPSASEVIRHPSNVFNGLVFVLAAVMAMFTLLWASSPEFLFSALMLVACLMSWGPVVALFAFGQTALSRIIREAKWAKLREIQQ